MLYLGIDQYRKQLGVNVRDQRGDGRLPGPAQLCGLAKRCPSCGR